MIPRTALSALLYASTAFAVCTKLEDCPQFESLKTDECQTFHHFLARGSTSPYPGHVIETVGKVCNALNTKENPKACGYEDVQYWAMNGGEKWCISSHEGAMNGAEQMRNYTQRCPDSHLIVMGFSQGGSVMLDVLGGGGGPLWGCEQKSNPSMNITSPPGSKIAAALVFGPTRRSANQSYTHGGGEISDGSAPRSAEELAGLQPYADAGILREYCQPGDPICAPHTDNKDMSKHLSYFELYSDEAAEWVIDLARKAESGDRTSDAKSMLHQTISHPIANVFIVIFVLFLVYFAVRKFAVWKTTRSPIYSRVDTTESV
ncbi:carbohydrate esterase family 5 protein [Bipolaris victoriae FI3]|uniref:Carbohydrate esterase family 5 protein n=2 Tax=Bipolaris TaxID=33194 RepID=W6YL26_COCC2|nr:carbohydrate esterase family 5 protein [Bipolaris zeicola 26-R-13]XP_014557336.1 carbohydrate esterase family 5 protein [Bipolaris victoriae FI3]EUC38178.1 carbohydrate esterase family 5 protein [Bipolaris zeicola 26-R-13]